MKVLSVRQPWAWLIVNNLKDVENRTWETLRRGPTLIHAGQQLSPWGPEEEALLARLGITLPCPIKDLPRAGIVGYTEVTGCTSRSLSPWFCGPYAFTLRNGRPLPFFPCRGALGFFKVPDDYPHQVQPLGYGARDFIDTSEFFGVSP